MRNKNDERSACLDCEKKMASAPPGSDTKRVPISLTQAGKQNGGRFASFRFETLTIDVLTLRLAARETIPSGYVAKQMCAC